MSSNETIKPEIVALLSAAGVTDGGQANRNIGALQNIAGTSLIGWQIDILRRCGVGTFLIEVDSVAGELLNLADGFRSGGARVEFVRSAKDLASFLNADAKLVIMAEAHYFSAPLAAELTARASPFIATIDGRDDNAAYERIDLNTRWAGFGLIEAATARSLMELPEGWSIASSLLRHSMQSGVEFLPVAQGKLQSGDVARISAAADADVLVERMLAERVRSESGIVERSIFGPIAKHVAPYIWASRNATPGINISSAVIAAGSFGSAVMGWSIAAAVTALLAIFLNTLFGVIRGLGNAPRHRSQSLLFWGTLIVSALATAWANTDYGPDAMAFMLMSIGLIAVAYRTKIPRWPASLLQSPALLAAAMLIAAGLSVVALGIKIIALVQLGLLIAGLYLPATKDKNSNQA